MASDARPAHGEDQAVPASGDGSSALHGVPQAQARPQPVRDRASAYVVLKALGWALLVVLRAVAASAFFVFGLGLVLLGTLGLCGAWAAWPFPLAPQPEAEPAGPHAEPAVVRAHLLAFDDGFLRGEGRWRH